MSIEDDIYIYYWYIIYEHEWYSIMMTMLYVMTSLMRNRVMGIGMGMSSSMTMTMNTMVMAVMMMHGW